MKTFIVLMLLLQSPAIDKSLIPGLYIDQDDSDSMLIVSNNSVILSWSGKHLSNRYKLKSDNGKTIMLLTDFPLNSRAVIQSVDTSRLVIQSLNYLNGTWIRK